MREENRIRTLLLLKLSIVICPAGQVPGEGVGCPLSVRYVKLPTTDQEVGERELLRYRLPGGAPCWVGHGLIRPFCAVGMSNDLWNILFLKMFR